MKFKKRSEVVDAERFDGTEDHAQRLCSWIGSSAVMFPRNLDEWFIEIRKARSTSRIYKGYWIIREPSGEFFGHDDSFELAYERVE